METETILLIGAGGHGKVVVDAMLRVGTLRDTIEVVDDDQLLGGTSILGLEVRFDSRRPRPARCFHVAVGDCAVRQQLHGEQVARGRLPITVAHPDASISPFATIAAGAFIAAGAVVGPSASIGSGTIVNHGAVVDHDCVVGEFSHVAPNATLGGAVTVGAGVLIGAGATVLPGLSIGDSSIVGAGTVVRRSVEVGEIYTGVSTKSSQT